MAFPVDAAVDSELPGAGDERHDVFSAAGAAHGEAPVGILELAEGLDKHAEALFGHDASRENQVYGAIGAVGAGAWRNGDGVVDYVEAGAVDLGVGAEKFVQCQAGHEDDGVERGVDGGVRRIGLGGFDQMARGDDFHLVRAAAQAACADGRGGVLEVVDVNYDWAVGVVQARCQAQGGEDVEGAAEAHGSGKELFGGEESADGRAVAGEYAHPVAVGPERLAQVEGIAFAAAPHFVGDEMDYVHFVDCLLPRSPIMCRAMR